LVVLKGDLIQGSNEGGDVSAQLREFGTANRRAIVKARPSAKATASLHTPRLSFLSE
jgi:hypothetical protein